MTNRKCQKCNDSLILNEKLNLMECASGRHVEPVNLIRPQWWNHCPKCKQIGTNDIDGEAILQVFEIVKEEVNGELQDVRKPVFKKVGEKKFMVVFEKNPAQAPITCRACGHEFMKSATSA